MTAAITEMLMQSHDGAIDLLPALPDEWASGEFRGVRARGGFEMDFHWADKRLTRLKIISKAGGTFRLRSHAAMYLTTNGTRRAVEPKEGVIEFPTSTGSEYLLLTK